MATGKADSGSKTQKEIRLSRTALNRLLDAAKTEGITPSEVIIKYFGPEVEKIRRAKRKAPKP